MATVAVKIDSVLNRFVMRSGGVHAGSAVEIINPTRVRTRSGVWSTRGGTWRSGERRRGPPFSLLFYTGTLVADRSGFVHRC